MRGPRRGAPPDSTFLRALRCARSILLGMRSDVDSRECVAIVTRAERPRSSRRRDGALVWRLLGQEPWQRLVHGSSENPELIAADVTAREQRESRAVGRPFRFVTGLAVFVLPGDERFPSFGHVEDRSAEVLPRGASIGFLDRTDRRTLRLMKGVELARTVLVPAPGGAFDACGREGAELREEAFAFLLTHVRRRRIRTCWCGTFPE